MQVTFKFAIGERVEIARLGGVRGRVRGLFVGEDKRRQASVAYVDAAGDPAGPAWFGEEELSAAD